MSEIENFVSVTNDVNDLYNFVMQLENRSDKLEAIQAINDYKAKSNKFTKKQRYVFVDLQLKLLESICSNDIMESRYIEKKVAESDKRILLHPSVLSRQSISSFVLQSVRECRKKLRLKNN